MFDERPDFTADERAQRLEDSLAESKKQTSELLRAINFRLTLICFLLAAILYFLIQK